MTKANESLALLTNIAMSLHCDNDRAAWKALPERMRDIAYRDARRVVEAVTNGEDRLYTTKDLESASKVERAYMLKLFGGMQTVMFGALALIGFVSKTPLVHPMIAIISLIFGVAFVFMGRAIRKEAA